MGEPALLERDAELATLAASAAESEAPPHHCLKKVLLIEDSEDLNRSLTTRLRKESFEVFAALDGISGLEIAQLISPDLILLDLALPRMHGLKVLHEMRHTDDPVIAPVIVMTGTRFEGLTNAPGKWGIERVLLKPMRQIHIVHAVQEVLRG